MFESHYDYLYAHFKAFAIAVGTHNAEHINTGIFGAHGDKCRQYFSCADKLGIHPYQVAAIYLLTYLNPWAKQVRNQNDGSWVKFEDWMRDNLDKFLPHLPEPSKEDNHD